MIENLEIIETTNVSTTFKHVEKTVIAIEDGNKVKAKLRRPRVTPMIDIDDDFDIDRDWDKLKWTSWTIVEKQ